MSDKAQGLVWDYPCPSTVNGMPFRPTHKYVLIAYADHADHFGKNIFPAIPTIAYKTGLDERTIQRLTHDMENMGMLVEDGVGPKGTNKWKLPFNSRGDSLSPVTKRRGDIPSGDIPSGDIPSGDTVTPESVKEQDDIKDKEKILVEMGMLAPSIWASPQAWQAVKRRLEEEDIKIVRQNNHIVISGLAQKMGQFTEAEIYTDKYSLSFANHGLTVVFEE